MTNPSSSMHVIAQRLNIIADEIGETIYEREEIIQGAIVALVAKQHLLMVGQPGCAKSVLAEAIVRHIRDGRLFSKAFDEYTTADEVLGGLDIKELSESGRQVRITTGMLPEAELFFGDEFFNQNGPTGHASQTAMNERLFFQEGQPVDIPLLSAFLATNAIQTDVTFAALWDRIHLRYPVGYLKARSNKNLMVKGALGRMAADGRRFRVQPRVTVTVAELHEAHTLSMALPWSDAAEEALLDIQEALHVEGIEISDRRLVECAVASAANAFLHGHTEVQVSDLSIMTAMAWNLLDQRKKAIETVLEITDDAMKLALELADQFDNIRDQNRNAAQLDQSHRAKQASKTIRDVAALTAEAQGALRRTEAGADSHRRLTTLLADAQAYRLQVGAALTGLDVETLKAAQR